MPKHVRITIFSSGSCLLLHTYLQLTTSPTSSHINARNPHFLETTHRTKSKKVETMKRVVLLTLALAVSASASSDCYLRQNTSSAIDTTMTKADQPTAKGPVKPFPSLTQCYKYNAEACCSSGHDEAIKSAFSSLLSSTCLREFPDLEVYMCFGCHPQQPKYVDLATKTIRVCKSFADSLFKPKSTKYDACGLNYPGRGYILPSFHFKTTKAFLNAFMPQYFSAANGWKVEISEANDGNCFQNAAGKMVVSAMAVIVSALFTLSMV